MTMSRNPWTLASSAQPCPNISKSSLPTYAHKLSMLAAQDGSIASRRSQARKKDGSLLSPKADDGRLHFASFCYHCFNIAHRRAKALSVELQCSQ